MNIAMRWWFPVCYRNSNPRRKCKRAINDFNTVGMGGLEGVGGEAYLMPANPDKNKLTALHQNQRILHPAKAFEQLPKLFIKTVMTSV